MAELNYKRYLVTKASPEVVFAAVTRGYEFWWTKPDNQISKIGDTAKFTFPPGKSFWTFEAKKLIPDQFVELECVDALHIHEGRPKEIEQEWLGTILRFAINGEDSETRVTLEHEGLNQNLLCYDVCEAGWDFFFVQSLKQYLDTGMGSPHTIPV